MRETILAEALDMSGPCYSDSNAERRHLRRRDRRLTFAVARLRRGSRPADSTSVDSLGHMMDSEERPMNGVSIAVEKD